MLKLSAWLRWFFLALIAFTLTIACTQQPNTTTTPPGSGSTPAASSQPIASGLNSWVGYSSHYVATKQELFTKEGLNVQEVFFQSATEEITAMLAGKLDIAWLTSGDAVKPQRKIPHSKSFISWIIPTVLMALSARILRPLKMPKVKVSLGKTYCLQKCCSKLI
jgi:NitT/TauT family transport system substrate-binding protein